MKRNFLIAAALCLSLVAFGQKAPKKSFSTELPPCEGGQWQAGELISMSDFVWLNSNPSKVRKRKEVPDH